MALFNESDIDNTTMTIHVDLEDMCDSLVKYNSSCDKIKSGMGINLSTPIIMLSTGVLGNCLALVVLYTAKREVRKTVFYTLLAGLAWTDLLGQLLVGPIAVIVYANNMKWIGGGPMCTYHAFMMICFGTITPLLVCCLSLERFLALRFTYVYARLVTRSKAKRVMVALWLFVLFFCTFPLMGFGSYELQFPGSWCFLNFHKESAADVGYASLFSVFNIVIILVIIICNTTVAYTLLRMRRKRRTKNSPSIEKRHGAKNAKQKKSLKLESETQMVWFLCAITIVFSACWLPLNVHILINQLTGQNDIKTDLITIRLASINQILDPWLYILLRKSLIFKIIKHVKSVITRRQSRRSIHNGTSSNNKITTNIALRSNECQINVICEKNDEHSTASSASNDSTSSTLKLIPKRNCIQRSLSADPKTRDNNDNGCESDVFLENNVCSNCLMDKPVYRDGFHSVRSKDDLFPLHINLKRLHSLPANIDTKSKRRHHSDSVHN